MQRRFALSIGRRRRRRRCFTGFLPSFPGTHLFFFFGPEVAGHAPTAHGNPVGTRRLPAMRRRRRKKNSVKPGKSAGRRNP